MTEETKSTKKKKSKRGSEDILETMSLFEFQKKVEGIKKLRDRALICCLYLTGARISEIVRYNDKFYPGFKASQIKYEKHKGEDLVIFTNIPILKNRKRKRKLRNIPVISNKDMDYFLIELFRYVQGLSGENPVLFPISRVRAWQIVNQHLGLFPHYLRHLRTTHLVVVHGFDPASLREFHGWANSAPADTYTHLNWRNIADKMMDNS